MTTEAQAFAQIQKLTPEGAVEYLQARKKITPTFGWQDLRQEEHAQQFTISRLTSADLLASLQDMITKSVQGDLSRRDFGRDAKQLLADAGWWGTSEVVDPATGEILKTTFDAKRLKLIFDTNTRQAHAAGQWERFQASKRTHPYLRYITKRDERVRAAHRAWDNVTLPVDDAFWNSHSPPNGWHCRCRVVAVNQADFEKGTTPNGEPMVKQPPEVMLKDWLNRRTGEVVRVPVGIDPGFGFNAGKARELALQRVVRDKLVNLNAPLGAALWDSVKKELLPTQLSECQAMVRTVATNRRASGQMLLVHVVDDATQAALSAQGVQLSSAAVLMRDTEVMHALRDSKAARGAALPESVFADLPALLPAAPVYLDTTNDTLLYVVSLPGQVGKVVVRVNYAEKGQFDGARAKLTANHVVTGGLIDASNLGATHYVRLK